VSHELPKWRIEARSRRVARKVPGKWPGGARWASPTYATQQHPHARRASPTYANNNPHAGRASPTYANNNTHAGRASPTYANNNTPTPQRA
jgi:hypothetical protein